MAAAAAVWDNQLPRWIVGVLNDEVGKYNKIINNPVPQNLSRNKQYFCQKRWFYCTLMRKAKLYHCHLEDCLDPGCGVPS